jgi:hypothetical protein
MLVQGMGRYTLSRALTYNRELEGRDTADAIRQRGAICVSAFRCGKYTGCPTMTYLFINISV